MIWVIGKMTGHEKPGSQFRERESSNVGQFLLRAKLPWLLEEGGGERESTLQIIPNMNKIEARTEELPKL